MSTTREASAPSGELDALRRARPRSRVVRASALVLGALALYSWTSGEIATAEFFSARRFENLTRFVSHELSPHALQGTDASLGDYLAWGRERWNEHGAQAVLATLQISIVAILLAGLFSWLFAPLIARNVTTVTPFGDGPRSGSRLSRLGYMTLRSCARALTILMRAVPEYILAFLLLAVLGPQTAWPAIVALAIHNGGILARLSGETIENLEPAPLQAMASLGARRGNVVLFGVFPLALGRFLLYFFYRFETCVREATVLGMLGVVSLGYWIQDARTRQFYDEMVFLVCLGVLLVFAADLASALARRFLRNG